MKKLKYLGAFALIGSLVGCGSSGNNPVTQAQGTVAATQNEMALSGNWDSGCSQDGLFGNFKSQKEEYHFGDDGTFERKFYFYSDGNCQTPSFVRVEDGTVNYEGTSSVNAGAPIDFSFTKVSLVPDNQDAVNELNTLKFCGVQNYVVGQASDVTANSSNTLCIGISPTPRTTYDTIKLVDNSHLALGNDANQTNQSQRPQNVNANAVFAKQ